MLVFTRRRNQAIRIGDVEVRVLRVGRDGVRLGIVAPPDVAVHREEIYDEIRAANRSAAGQSLNPEDLATRLRRQ
jgi:carbon storage regulator